MKKILSLLFCFTVCVINVFSNTVTIDYPDVEGIHESIYLPTAINRGTYQTNAYYSISQQLYFASELSTASSTTITAITFYYVAGSPSLNRKLRVWLNETSITAFSTETTNPNLVSAGRQVYSSKKGAIDNGVDLTPGESYTLIFDEPFVWDGESNLVVTVFDSTGVKNSSGTAGKHNMFPATAARFLHIADNLHSDFKDVGWNLKSLTALTAISSNDRHYANKITFTFAAPSAPATPTGLSVAEYATSAYILWESVGTATSYKLQQSTDGTNWSELAYGTTTDPYHWTGLTPETTYYVRVAATNASGDSEYSDAVSFTTDALHIHDAITFDKWTTTAELPTSGNYYLANDVEISSITQTSITGSLNLCLNGHSVTYTHTNGGINITSTGSLTLYDPVGGGVITSPNGTATINVANGGSIAIYGGTVVNSADATRAIKTHAHGALTLSLVDNASNSTNMALAINCGYAVNVNLARTWIADGYYSTLCLPFPLSSEQISSVFGAGTELATLSSSSLDGETINLVFATAPSIQAGKPYLIKPANNAVNPSFNSVDVANGTTDITTDYVDFKGTLSPTYLESDEDILFLGAGNTLGWPLAAGNINGMRAYFYIHDLPAGAPALRHARFIAPDQSMPSALDETTSDKQVRKHMENGQLIIIRDGKRYNALGAEL